MLVGSCALYAIVSLLVIVPMAFHSVIVLRFLPVLSEIQVRAPRTVVGFRQESYSAIGIVRIVGRSTRSQGLG